MEKVEKVTVSVAIVLFDMKMHSNSVPRGFLVTLAKGHL